MSSSPISCIKPISRIVGCNSGKHHILVPSFTFTLIPLRRNESNAPIPWRYSIGVEWVELSYTIQTISQKVAHENITHFTLYENMCIWLVYNHWNGRVITIWSQEVPIAWFAPYAMPNASVFSRRSRKFFVTLYFHEFNRQSSFDSRPHRLYTWLPSI